MKISIIIPAYNAAIFLEEAVHSALQQDYANKEIIIVENNSTDDTALVARKMVAKYPDVVQLIEEKKQGCSAARNAGIRAATGDWLQFLDADDLLEAKKLSQQMQLLKADTDWIIAAYRHQYTDGSIENCFPNIDPWKGLVHDFAIGNTCANLYKKKSLAAVGNWDETLTDNTDHNLHFRLLKATANYVLDEQIRMTYRHHPHERVSTRQPIGRMQRKLDFHHAVNEYLKKSEPDYWQKNSSWFDAALLRTLRMLATVDLSGATSAYKRIYKDQLPELDYRIISRIVQLYPLIGFRTTEKLRLRYGRLLSPNWKNRIKQWLRTQKTD